MSGIDWLILWCVDDTSYSLINSRDAIFDEDAIKVGDSITFFYCQKEYTGEVAGFGDEEQYDSLCAKLIELNSRNNRAADGSFHDDQPRKTRGKGKFEEALDALKPKQRKQSCDAHYSKAGPSKQITKKNTPAVKPLAQLLNAYSNEDSDETALDSSPESSPTPEERNKEQFSEVHKVKRKTAVKGRTADMQVLKQQFARAEQHLNKKNNNNHQSTSNADAASSINLVTRCSAKANPPIFENSDDEDIPVLNKTVQERRRKSSLKQRIVHGSEEDNDRQQKEAATTTVARNEGASRKDSMLRYSSNDPNVSEVRGRCKALADKHFYISRVDLQKARMAGNASVFARSLLVAAFTDEALLNCSVSGGQYRAGGRANMTRKPALDADTVALIVEAAFCRQEHKGWKPESSKKEILNALRQKLVDVRPRLQASLATICSEKKAHVKMLTIWKHKI